MERSIEIRGRLLSLSRPKVMGIINVTPDSFHAASRAGDNAAGIARRMLDDGADILDIGGYSTRPGAAPVSPDEEYDRLAPALESIRRDCPDAIMSVDTFRAVVANFGVDIINDIGGGTLDPDIIPAVAELQVPYVLMHLRGTPATMQQLTQYDDVAADVLQDLAFKVADCRQAGIADVIVDPGFGFAKTTDQNYRLLAALDLFHSLNCPVLAGISRKTMLWKPLDITPAEAGDATVAADAFALMLGADIIRVHDVKPAVQTCRLFDLLRDNSDNIFPNLRYTTKAHD